jgi:hypothetical protein
MNLHIGSNKWNNRRVLLIIKTGMQVICVLGVFFEKKHFNFKYGRYDKLG